MDETTNEFDEIELDPLVEELVPQDSRYFKDAITVEYEGCKMYDIPQVIDIPPNDEDDDLFVVTSDCLSRLDKVSNEYYETSKYWWIIGLVNKVSDPFDPMFKKTLRVPSLNDVIISGVI